MLQSSHRWFIYQSCLFLNGSNFEVDVIHESRHPALAGTRRISPAHPTYFSNGLSRLPNSKKKLSSEAAHQRPPLRAAVRSSHWAGDSSPVPASRKRYAVPGPPVHPPVPAPRKCYAVPAPPERPPVPAPRHCPLEAALRERPPSAHPSRAPPSARASRAPPLKCPRPQSALK